MKKIERLLAIIMVLLDQEIVSTSDLAERFHVTKRTIFRDIETIEYAGFPILSHTGRNGGFSFPNSFKLRTSTYGLNDRQEILNALCAKEELVGRTTTTIKEKIRSHALQTQQQLPEDPVFSFSSPTIHRPVIEKENKQKIAKLSQAIQERQKVAIVYVDYQGEITERVIWPIELFLNNGSWYLSSYCEHRRAYRAFKLTRIRQLERRKSHFFRDNHRFLQEEKLEAVQKIHLEFKKNMLGKLYDFYTDQEVVVGKTTITVRCTIRKEESIIPFLLMFGENVLVRSPECLRKQHQKAIEELNRIYPLL